MKYSLMKQLLAAITVCASLPMCLADEAGQPSAAAAETQKSASPAKTVSAEKPQSGLAAATGQAGFRWHSDYREATKAAERRRQMLMVVFLPSDQSSNVSAAVEGAFGAERVQKLLSQVTAVKLSADTAVSIGGESQKLLSHAAFGELRGQPGLAMIDLRNPKSDQFRRVVSIFPFYSGRTFDATQLHVLLTLPSGSLTQRTLVYAVRTHPERPQSALSTWHPVLADETESHSEHQATIGVQGHHQFDSRFHRINGRMACGACSEVCAESWPGQGLFEGAIECVDSWRQSSGHWASVSRRHRFFGYDMKRGRNGTWYATGLFSGR